MATAIEVLKALANNTPAIPSTIIPQDPAIVGAKREKAIVKLGMDPDITAHVAEAVTLKAQIQKHQTDFETYQETLRNYGKIKRDLYNDTFKSDITTIAIPYDAEGDTRYVQVVCSSRYSVNQKMALNNRPVIGEWFDRLFQVETTKKLKSDSENLIRNLLKEMGLQDQELENAMDSLFETEHKVSVKEEYESISQDAPGAVKDILNQSVSKAAPSLKF